MKIVVLGYIIRGPLGGLVWHHFQYVYGLKLMGHEVLFLEDSEEYAACYNPETHQLSKDPSYGIDFIKQLFERYGLADHWAYFDFHTNAWIGKSKKEVSNFLNAADVLLNISGVNPLREWTINIPKRVFIDTDPVFTQIKHLSDVDSFKNALQHNSFFTFGENYNSKSCLIPKDGIQWKPTRQPVVLQLWETKTNTTHKKWTTVMQWDSYKTGQWDGVLYGMKSQSFEGYFNLPQTINETFELALGSASAPKKQLTELGWSITDPLVVTKTPESYKTYISHSKGEWSIAKHGYVISRSGWFSERSAAYLASSKPVIVQDTGFTEFITTGKGLFAFNSPEDLKGIFIEVNRNYAKHCKWAKEICDAYFNFNAVLTHLLANV